MSSSLTDPSAHPAGAESGPEAESPSRRRGQGIPAGDEQAAGFVQVTLPELGPNLLEAIVVGWEKHPGDWVDQEETICIVSADGLRAAVASSASGYMVRLLAGVGARIGPGTSLAEIAIPLPEDGDRPPEPNPSRDADPVERSSFHSPAVRSLAAEHGIDLTLLAGSGAGGRIRKEDVLAYLAQRGAVRAVRSTADEGRGARTT
jgi:pyruvate/2-oxoglutarate dehydrogenase complex dihydrolipoamide acyltransferase (E2) component